MLDKICSEQKCNHYIEWEYEFEPGEQPYRCVSCKLQGQSHNILEIAKDCPYRDSVQQQLYDANAQSAKADCI